ncbi:MAG: ABC transporter permease, partial [Sinobacterium sp.]|nr:ABC transporter permease [Sinobacterium sp.]
MNFFLLLRFELRAIFRDPTVKLTVFGATILYLLLYPTPYLFGVATEQPIVVVDLDQSSLSRQVIRHADASSQIKVVAKRGSLLQAQEMIKQGQAHGVLIIPRHFKKDLMLGRGSTLSYGGDASYFLIYGAIAKGLVITGMEASKQVQRVGALAHGASYQEMKLSLKPIKLNTVATFNPTESYPPYL